MAHQGNPLSARIPDANDSTIVASALTWSRLSKTRRGRGGIESSNRCASMAVMLLISAGRPRMSCEIELRPAALRALKRVDRQDQPRIQGAIALLAADPRPPGAKALQGCDALRIRVGDYRTIYTVQDNRLLVIVVTLGHRREVDR
ncbi:type II toxin-antitoxin system RelE family toxin [Jonesia denitrificans]|nr:type II toxin-antitoxin system RelE/ParE family toxin [Jonesia denitrificans]